jgi:hypothetical protein
MHTTVAVPPPSSLTALRGAVGEVVGAGDAVGCWDRLVSLWRIFLALDELMAVLWGIVDRLRAGEMVLDGRCPAGAVAVLGERPGVAGSGLVRLRPARQRPVAAGVSAMAGPCGLMGPMGSVGRARWRFGRVECGRRDRGLAGMSPVLAVRGRRFSDLGWGGLRNCALIVPVR